MKFMLFHCKTERMYSSPEAYNMQHQQPNAYLTHPPHMAKGKKFVSVLYITKRLFLIKQSLYSTAEGFVHSHPNHSHYNKHNVSIDL